MFNYFQWIGANINEVFDKIKMECDRDGFDLRILEQDDLTPESFSLLTVLVNDNRIVNIYRG